MSYFTLSLKIYVNKDHFFKTLNKNNPIEKANNFLSDNQSKYSIQIDLQQTQHALTK
jgi:hypothetical protein